MSNLQAATVTTAPESPQVKAWMHSIMEKYGWTEQEVRQRSAKAYGSVESTMRATERTDAEDKAAIERAFPDGYFPIQIGVSRSLAHHYLAPF